MECAKCVAPLDPIATIELQFLLLVIDFIPFGPTSLNTRISVSRLVAAKPPANMPVPSELMLHRKS